MTLFVPPRGVVFQISFSLLNHVDVRWVHHCLINRSVMSDVGRGSVGVYQCDVESYAA